MGSSHKGYDVWADYDRNILYIKLWGRLDKSELQEMVDEGLAKARRFDGPFGVISDPSELELESPEEAKLLKRGQQGLKQEGLADVVRVVHENTDPLVKMNLEVGSLSAGYGPDLAPTIQAAEEKLDF